MATDDPLTSAERRALRLGSEPAMPITERDWDKLGEHPTQYSHLGLSKREHFAGLALKGLLSNPLAADSNRARLVEGAVRYADALLEELAK